jgi:choline kinase
MWMVVTAAGDGSRLRSETGGRPKQLLEVEGKTLLARLLALGRALDLLPMVVTRPAHAACFAAAGVEVLVEEEETAEELETLQRAGRKIAEDFVWIGGDTLFTDLDPLHALLAAHLAERPYASFFYCRSERFKAKLRPAWPVPRVTLTRDPGFPFSLPNFGIQSAASFRDLAVVPRGEYVQRALDRGERVCFREYAAPVFEIDTPADLATARRYFSRCLTC